MRGSMREIRPGYWELRVSLGRDPVSGKPRLRTKGLRASKRQAERELALLIREVADGKVAPAQQSVGELIDLWLEHLDRDGRSPTTMRGYRSLRNQLPEDFLRLPLKKLTPRVVDDLYRRLERKPGRGPSTGHHIHAMLRAACNQGMRWEMLERNPTNLATSPRLPRHEIEPPPIAEIRAVVEAAGRSNNPENGLAFRLLAAMGCRRSELCGLRWSDVDLKKQKVTLRNAVVQVDAVLHEKDTKAHQQRTVTLDDDTAELLRHHRRAAEDLAKDFEVPLDPAAFIFSRSPDGLSPIPPDRLSQAWRRVADSLGVDARLHDLRHLQASLLLDAGESITTVAARLGHRDSATTLRVYSHLMPGADERAASVVGEALRSNA